MTEVDFPGTATVKNQYASKSMAILIRQSQLPPSTGITTTVNLPIPGGGYSIGMDMHSDGTIISQVDIFGGYVGSTVAGSTWQQIATQTSMPSAYSTPPTPFLHGGTWAARIAPSNSSIMYCMYLGNENQQTLCTLLKSINKGVTWTATGFVFFNPTNGLFGGNRAEQGQRIVIDPNNPNIVYASTSTKLYASTDGGVTFAQVTGPPAAVDPGYVAMQYDPTGGTTGGSTNRLIIGVSGTGLYVSTNAYNGSTSTWTAITGGPTTPGFGKMATDGNYYCNTTGESSTLYRVNTSNTVNTFTVDSNGIDGFDIDPNNPARFTSHVFGQFTVGGPINGTPVFTKSTGNPSFFDLAASTTQPWFKTAHDGGSGDTGIKAITGLYFDPFNTTSSTSVTIGTGTKTWTDVPTGLNIVVGDLLRVTNTGTPANYMLGTVSTYTSGNLSISVLSAGPGGYLGTATGGSGTFSAWTITKERLWATGGTGIFYTDGLQVSTPATMHWNPDSIGIEDMVSKNIIWPVNGVPVLCVADRGAWKVTNNPYNATVGVNGYGPVYSTELIEGSAIDWASNQPAFIAYVGNPFSGFSTTGGTPGPANWTAFGATPTGTGSVCMVAAASSSYLIAATTSGIFYTTNGGSTWTAVPGLPTSGWIPGGASTTGVAPKALCADRVNTGTFYAFNQSNNTVYQIILPAVTVNTQHTGSLSNSSGSTVLKLSCLPNCGTLSVSGHLFFSIGNDESAATYTSLATVASFTPSAASYPLMYSTNSGTSWTAVPHVAMALFGIGKSNPSGNGYPAIFIAGWLSGIYGIYRSDDFDLFPNNTWNNIGTLARGWLDLPTCLEGDPNQWGRYIIGHNGSSFAIGQISNQPNTWP